MWYKHLFLIIIFCLFAISQNSFFSMFSLWGAVPNIVFILFFSLIFFSKNKLGPEAFFYAVLAGFLLDIFSQGYFGTSIILLIAIGFSVKKIQSILSEHEDKYPFIYFLVLFVLSFLAYSLILLLSINMELAWSLGYNLMVASVVFLVYKKFCIKKAKCFENIV